MTLAPTALRVQALGELTLVVDSAPCALPRSRKARALLAYLAVTGRAHRRDHLSDLLWDVTDDRRAALRWSLSKLRKAHGQAASRLVATRDHVELVLRGGELDLSALRAAARAGFESQSTESLVELARSCRGELLEGMLLPEFDAFEAWLEAERAEARALHARLCRALVLRLEHEPGVAFEFARAWVERSGSKEAQGWVESLAARLGDDHRAKHIPVVSTAAAPAGPPASPPASQPASARRPSRTALVGRESEMARLKLIAEEARAQRAGRVVLLVGEPGLGKTRILEELQTGLADRAPWVLQAVFHEAEQHRPLGPLLDATRELEGWQPSGAESAAHEREQLLEALAGLIRRGAALSGLGLVLLDDAHLCDPSSSELLHYLVRTSTRCPLVTVLACRPAELEDNLELSRALAGLRRRHSIDELRLRPLDPGSMRSLVAQASDGSADDQLEQSVVEQSAGNPLLGLELARAGIAGSSAPRSFSELVLERMASLTDDTRALVRWAAIFGRGPLSVLQAASANDVQDPLNALEQAARYHLIQLDSGELQGSFALEHPLVRRAVYDSISSVRRAAMHQRAAEVLESVRARPDSTAQVAYHATRANRPDLAARALVRGAERCSAQGAIKEAASLAEQALALVPELPPDTALEVELDSRLVLSSVRRPEDPDAFVAWLSEVGLQALDLGLAEPARKAFNAGSHLRWNAGSVVDGYGLARQAWHASRAGDADAQARGNSLLALCLASMEMHLGEAQALAHEAEVVGRTRGQAEPAELALARALLHIHAGRYAEARRDLLDTRTLARLEQATLREAGALEFTAKLEYATEEYAAAIAAADALIEVSSRIREGGEAAIARAVRALASNPEPAQLVELSEIVQALWLLDDKRRLAWVANRASRCARSSGQPAEARRFATLALEAARAVEAYSECAIATCELMASAVDDAAYAEAEETLSSLEAGTAALSHEARTWIREVTLEAPAVSPVSQGSRWNT